MVISGYDYNFITVVMDKRQLIIKPL